MSSKAPQLPPGFVAGVATVLEVKSIGPRLRRVRIAAPELATLDCGDGPAPGIRLLIPPSGHPVVMPTPSLESGLVYEPGAVAPEARTVTVRRHDPAAAALDVEIALTHVGVLADWAASVEIGSEVGFAAPRTFPNLPAGPLVLLGDETAISGIGTIIDARLAGDVAGQDLPIYVGIEVESSDDEVDLGVPVAWLSRDAGNPGVALVAALASLDLPAGSVVWLAGEAGAVRSIRSYLQVSRPGLAHVRASGYWKLGVTSVELDDAILNLTQKLVASCGGLDLLDEFALALEEPGPGGAVL